MTMLRTFALAALPLGLIVALPVLLRRAEFFAERYRQAASAARRSSPRREA